MDNSEKKILVAEDEELLRDIFALVLRDEDYQVDIAANGAEAWDLLNKNHYHLLATDLFMPVMNGFELILKTQKSSKFPFFASKKYSFVRFLVFFPSKIA